uniref:Mitochondrial fission protein ELM1 n=1 Tax=Oryza glumipatula TaxID=40148 RepID=A0A0D9ZKJ6_9ORYZ
MEPLGGGGPAGAPEIFAGGIGARGSVRRAVVIGNGCAGAENQCLGLLRALGLADRLTLYRAIRPTGGINKWLHFLPISLHKLVDQVLRQMFSSNKFATLFQGAKMAQYTVCNGQSLGLSSVLEADTKRIVTMVNDTFEKEGLALVVACGRDTISYASSIRCLAPDNVFVIQIQHPRYRLDRFDLVVTPRHDYYALTTRGQREFPHLLWRWITAREPPGPNVIYSAALRTAASDWHDELANSPKPLVVVNIGGPTRPNPHLGHLAWADAFVITADSISMLSEACSTGKPVYVVGTEHCRWKFSDFHNRLHERGAVRPFTGLEDMSDNWSYPPLNDAIDVAARVPEVLAERGWTVG